MDLNRMIAPEAKELEQVLLIQPKEIRLSNGIPVFYIRGGEEELLKLEMIFHAGNLYEESPFIANACNALLSSGTSKRSSADIAEYFDYYGAYYQHETAFDRASLSLYTLNKYFEETLSVLKEIVTDAQFPEEEIRIFAENTRQRLQINLTKNEFVARRTFNHLLFKTHPYGRKVDSEDLDNLSRVQLQDFYRKYYSLGNCTLVLSGNVTDEVLKILSDQFSGIGFPEPAKHNPVIMPEYHPIQTLIEKKESLQSAIRIGKRLITKQHPDFIDMQILNTVLGGYFGSRLMTNIREDKGYTYGIGSGISAMKEAGYFYIASEVGADVCEKAISEIYHEINRLRTELIPEEELMLVRNYMMGVFIGSIENIFSYADKFKSVYFHNLDYSYYENFFNKIKTINSERLLSLANQYFNSDSFIEVVVGKK